MLSEFLGRELVEKLAKLEGHRIFGAWDRGNPSEVRQKAQFAPVLYGEEHSHPHQEICLLLSGQCRFSFQHRVSILKAGDMIICPGHVQHAEAFCSSRESYRLGWWSLWEKDPMLHVRRYRRKGGYDVEHMIRLTTLTNVGKERLDVLRDLTARSPRQAPEPERLREAMFTVTLELYRQVLKSGETPFDARAELVRKVTDFVRAHASQALALADVANAIQMSPNYLTSLFHSQTGMSLGRFILSERIALSQRMLRQPGASVKSVALELGFSDPFTFSRAFKRIATLAPQSWTRTHVNGQVPQS
ncbi:MAG TPA: AraC family transcriptional regulator [Opitutaceae bacterium]|jgi:AraC-like DNA-binding protein